jgi:alginate O-acetyltransferase complex protein AlgI
MLFHTSTFLVFFLVVFALHWWVIKRDVKWQNGLLLVASYFFYGCWDWRFVALLLFSTLLDYFTGLRIGNTENERERKMWLWISVGINVGLLGVFKYYDFFALSFADLMSTFGWKVDVVTLQLILPVGISFYTFHGLSYVLDIYHRRIEPDRNLVDYALFVSYFPLLVAGPIERATHLLPQLKKARVFSYPSAVLGLRLILWGICKKVAVADMCALYVDFAHQNIESLSPFSLFFAAVMFSIQIYGDFSGYTDIALGVSRLFGIQLIENFKAPYLTKSLSEFWTKWHISLTSWFRDYIYIPLGGSKCGRLRTIRNTILIFLLSGFWHGANWTFMLWGLMNACILLVERLFLKKVKLDFISNGNTIFLTLINLLKTCFVFLIVTTLWVFFRTNSIQGAISYVEHMFCAQLFLFPSLSQFAQLNVQPVFVIVTLFVFCTIEIMGRNRAYTLEIIEDVKYRGVRFIIYYSLILWTFFNPIDTENFIYFQF